MPHGRFVTKRPPSTATAAAASRRHTPLAHPSMQMSVRLLLLLLGAVAGATAASTPPADTPLRIWIDDFFFSKGETQLLREAAAASGGAALVAGTTHNRVLQLKSYQRTGVADVLWTGPAVSGQVVRLAGGYCRTSSDPASCCACVQ